MTEAPEWFVAVLLLRAEANELSESDALVDHQVRLVQASSPGEALARAEAYGRAEEHTYRNEAGEQVRWRFLGLHDLVRLDAPPPSDGAELYSWRSAATGALDVVASDELTVFWSEQHGQASARQILGDDRHGTA